MDRISFLGRSYEGEDLRSVAGFIGDALVGDELAVDTLTATVGDDSRRPLLLAASDGVLLSASDGLIVAQADNSHLDKEARYGDPVAHYRDKDLFGKFFLESAKRVGMYTYTLNAVSAVGLLLTSYHYGGMYDGESFGAVLADIIGGRVPYTVDAGLASVPGNF